jgi:hypothetical protein
LQREERKSESPQPHVKSVISYVDRKQVESILHSSNQILIQKLQGRWFLNKIQKGRNRKAG